METNKPKLTDLQQVKLVSGNMPSCDFLATNNRYGHAYHLKKYAGISESSVLNCTIEHGLNIVHDAVCANEVWHHCKKILTFSRYRKEVIERNADIEAVVVGPYIAYADAYYSEEETKETRAEYGRTLLVLPPHSSENVGVGYDRDTFLKKIDEVSGDFNTVLVCLYYMDIDDKTVNCYRKKGYVVVSAGNSMDAFFLPRQKTIFQLSDAVMGNAMSTGLAYAMYFDKPVYLVRQPVESNGKNNICNTGTLERNEAHMEELYKICSDQKFGLLKEQKEWGRYMFGLDCVKTRLEMRDVLVPLLREERV